MKNVISNRKMKTRINRKTNSDLAVTISLANKYPGWKSIAKIISGSTRKYSSVNLDEVDRISSTGDTILIPGKVLASGNLTKKVRIVSLSISYPAREKLKKTKSEYATILEEIKINNKGEGIKLLK